MKVAIISDTHDNLATLAKFLAYIRENPVQAVIHCGDIASGETLEYLAEGFKGPIFACLGNMDYERSVETAAAKLSNRVELFKNFGQAEFDGLKIGFCHHREVALRHCGSQEFNFVFYGHTHKPWKEEIVPRSSSGSSNPLDGSDSPNCVLANPGNLAGMISKATFAVLDAQTKKLELKIVDRL